MDSAQHREAAGYGLFLLFGTIKHLASHIQVKPLVRHWNTLPREA